MRLSVCPFALTIICCLVPIRYEYWSAYAEEQQRQGEPPEYSAAQTHENMTLWDGTPAHVGLHQPDLRIHISSMANLSLKLTSPGPLSFRRLVGSARLVDSKDGRELRVYRELVCMLGQGATLHTLNAARLGACMHRAQGGTSTWATPSQHVARMSHGMRACSLHALSSVWLACPLYDAHCSCFH